MNAGNLTKHQLKVWRIALNFRADNGTCIKYIIGVSVADIIKTLPMMSEFDRRAIREVLLELANQYSNVAACNHAALDGALMLDRMEDENAR